MIPMVDPERKRQNERHLFWASALTVLAFCLAPSLFSSPARISIQRLDITRLPEITVYLTVLDDADRAILGIANEEIIVTIDGVAQTGTSLRSALEQGEYLAVVLAFDRSGSMKSALEETKQAALNFLRRMSAGDRVAVVSFDDAVRVDSDLSDDRGLIENAIRGISLGKDTALYDSVRKGLEILESASTHRKAFVILSDGKDNRSKLKKPEILSLARNQSVPLFTIGLGSGIDKDGLIELASGSGGNFFQAAGPQDLIRLYQTIAEQLQNQYILTFSSSFGQDEAWHDLELTFKDPAGMSASASQKFLATTSPGVSRGALSRYLGAPERHSLAQAAGLGALLGLAFGLFLFLLIKLARREERLFWPLILGLLLASAVLGAIVALVWFGIK